MVRFTDERMLSALLIVVRRSPERPTELSARLFMDNLGEKHGMFAGMVRDDVSRQLRREKSIFDKILRHDGIQLWMTRVASPAQTAGLLTSRPYAGFRPLRSAVTSSFTGGRTQYFLVLMSEEIPDLEDVQKMVLDIRQLQNRIAEATEKRVVLHGSRTVTATSLKNRELDCLRWLAAGKTLSEISEILGLTYKSVRYNIDSARRKYGYSTLNQTLVQSVIEYNLTPMGNLGSP